uniref:Uncharacterized protein n=1 Tax=Pipistrellus kuhlii TaxID=59472 RepID=A0A7J8B1G2_PIPKU|nr:hypothetical protein mPipKuh1_007713 [Pipistrellus kuhlii]
MRGEGSVSHITATSSWVSFGISSNSVVRKRNCVLSNYYHLGSSLKSVFGIFYLQYLYLKFLFPILLLPFLLTTGTTSLQDFVLNQLSHTFPFLQTTKGLCPSFLELFCPLIENLKGTSEIS